MNRVKKITCIILITTPLLAAAAQNVPDRKSSTDQQPNPVDNGGPVDSAKQKILAVLDQLIETQKTFADGNLRVMIQAQVADMLWSHNESRARRLFEDALQLTPSPALGEQSTSAQASQAAGGPPYAARNAVIQLIMRHDSDWATKLVESAGNLANVEPKFRNDRKYSERATLQLQLGVYFAQQDPQRAVWAAKPFVENGDVNSLIMLIGMMRSKDNNAADELFIQAIAKAKLGQPSFDDISRLAMYLFPSFGEGVIRYSSNAGRRDPFTPIPIGSAAINQFLDLAYEVVTRRLDAAMTGTDGARLNARSLFDYAIPKLLLPYFDRFTPDKAPAFRARVEEALRRVPPEERQYLILTEPGTVHEILARADAIAELRLKDSLYQRAILQASYGSDFEQAAAIIERLSNEDGRSKARNTLRQRMERTHSDDAWSALNKGDFDNAEMLLAGISDWPSDVLLVLSLIGQLSVKDKPRATRLLDEYKRRAAGIENGIERALRLMDLTGVAANIDLNRGFEDMKLAILEFNRAGFVPELQKYRDTENEGTKGRTTAMINVGLSALLNDWHLQWLGRVDFDRAIALTQHFQMREASALMQLVACRGALSKIQTATPKVSTAPEKR